MSHVADFLKRLGIQHPIIQAPMAGIATPVLAAGVSNAGALGSLGLGASKNESSVAAIRATRELTSKPFNVNVFCHTPPTRDAARERAWLDFLRPRFASVGAVMPNDLQDGYRSFIENEDMLTILLEERPQVVSFHFGLPPTKWIRRLQREGIATLGCATTPEEAAEIEAAGVDGVIAQGEEAGGHRGLFNTNQRDEQIGTLALVRRIRRQSTLPIIAAGGIMDGAGIHAAIALGAVAAQMGTAFILCPESAADSGYRQQLKSPRARHTRITSVFSGRPARGISNGLTETSDTFPQSQIPDYPLPYGMAKALHAAAKSRGDLEYAAYWAGQGAPLARELPAAELVSTLVNELRNSQLAVLS